MIILDKITKKIGARILFEEVTASFNKGNRYGLTGPNGAGKSTLLKIMMGTEEATSGTVRIPAKTGFLKQNLSDYLPMKVIDVVIMGNKRLWKTIQERDALYEQELDDAAGMRLAELECIIAEEDGYSAEADAGMLLHGIGIPDELLEAPMHSLPTDFQFRALICQALFGKPEALLLDEPTNHLDLESIKWLEEFLHNYEGTLIVVSHDRHFLNAITTHIADIDYDTIITYPGNYDNMVLAKSELRARIDQDNKSKDKKVSQLKEFVAKFGAGTRASQVQSRIREIDRLAPQELKKSNIQRPFVHFQDPAKPSGQITIKVDRISKAFDDIEIMKNFTLEIHRGDKIGVIGNNGRGKTTLLKLLATLIPSDKGQVTFGNQVDLGYFPQNHGDIVDKGENIDMVSWLKRICPHVHEQEVRGTLGKLLFPGDDSLKLTKSLSGGETARLIIGNLMLHKHNTLILDEPNNHLDLEAVSALAWGLKTYKGTVIVASHDRDLIDTVATKILAFEDDGLHFFDGPLEEYLQKKARDAAAKAPAKASSKKR